MEAQRVSPVSERTTLIVVDPDETAPRVAVLPLSALQAPELLSKRASVLLGVDVELSYSVEVDWSEFGPVAEFRRVGKRDVFLTQATLLMRALGGMQYWVRQVRDAEVRVAPYAQYAAAVHCTFVPRGARARRGIWQTYEPSLIVLAGWHEIRLPDTGPVHSRDLSYGSTWDQEARTALAPYKEFVVRDYQGHDSHRAIEHITVKRGDRQVFP